LNNLYDASGRAFRVEEVAGGFQLLSRKRFARWLRRLTHTPSELRLSAPAMETLAVVAYRQPVLRADIEAIRGVNCGEILRQLMERDLVRISGRSEELGRPYLYSTTKRFLQLFGLRDLDQLPRAEVLRTDPKSVASDQPSRKDPDQAGDPKKEETDVSITLEAEPQLEQLLAGAVALQTRQPVDAPRAEDEFDDDDDLDEDDEDDLDDVDDDEELEEDLEEDEWEEVDEEEDDEWEDDDEDDDDWEDDEEEDEDEDWE
jgi:segregation and condensation protein B